MAKDDSLRKALSEIAEEEADLFERSLTAEERHQAEALFRRHRKKALSLLARRTRGAGKGAAFLRAAAAVLVILGGVLLALRQPPRDITPLAPAAGSSAAPFYTPAPSPAAAPSPTVIPTVSPTAASFLTSAPTKSPTNTPFIEPTSTPSPTQTPLPTQTPAAMQEASVPPAWQGAYFPGVLPAGYSLEGLETSNDADSAAYSNGDDRIVFTEYAILTSLPVPDGARVAYVQWGGGAALRSEKDGCVTYTWDQDGRSFSLTATDGKQAEEIARSVKRTGE